MRPRVILADDHQILMEGLRSLLEPEFDLVASVTNGRELVAKAKEIRPDVVIADISMPLLNGIDAAQQILNDNPRARMPPRLSAWAPPATYSRSQRRLSW